MLVLLVFDHSLLFIPPFAPEAGPLVDETPSAAGAGLSAGEAPSSGTVVNVSAASVPSR